MFINNAKRCNLALSPLAAVGALCGLIMPAVGANKKPDIVVVWGYDIGGR